MSHSPQREEVRHALKELQLKTRLLEEERDYYVNLQLSSAHAFEDHRRELQQLVDMERRRYAKIENDLQVELEMILAKNRSLHNEERDARAEHNTRLSAALEQMQHDAAARETRMRHEIEMCQKELHAIRQKKQDQESEARTLRDDIDRLNGEQSMLNRRNRELADQHADLVERHAEIEARQRIARAQRLAAQRASSAKGAPKTHRETSATILHPFLPSGKVDREHIGVPTTHNANAYMQVIRKSNYRSPPRGTHHNEPRSTRVGAVEFEILCESIRKELNDLQAEHNIICKHLADVQPSFENSDRLRSIYAQMDRKRQQLQHLRDSQTKQEDYERLKEMLREVEAENAYCAARMNQLLEVIHGKSM